MSVDVQQAVRMSSMLQALRQRWRAEDAHENASKAGAEIWDDAEVDSQA